MVRAALRPLAGRDRPIWRALRSPGLRFAVFADHNDCVIYGLLASLPRVEFVQIGANDGKRNDPIWPFRAYPHWHGLLVEPVEYLFRRLQANYRPWKDRFRFVNAAIGPTSGMQPFHYLPESDLPPAGYDQIGSLDEARVREHARHFSAAGLSVITSEVRCFTFAELCDFHGIERFDLLHIDAEGYDAAILEQVDLQRFDPKLVLYEHVHLSTTVQRSILERLATAGYLTRPLAMDTVAISRRALADHAPLRLAWQLTERRPDARSVGESAS